MIELRTLGTLDLLERTDGHQVLSVLAQPKRVGFLTFLAIATPRGLHQRDTLLGIFWPDSSDKRARNVLNQTVFALRRTLGQKLFIMNGEPGVGLDPDHLQCDVWEFEAALASGEKEDALDLYRGNFLEGFFLPGCLEFERWADSERSRLRDLAMGAVLSLSKEMESAGNPVGAVGWLRRAREWASYDEHILRRQVELLLALGDRSGAVREYESFARRLSVDLGMEPSEEAQSLLDKPPEMARAWQSAGTPKGSTQGPLLPPPGPGTGEGRRFSLPQTAAMVCLAAVVGVGAALSAPRLWTAATSTFGPVPIQTESSKNVVVLPLENATGDPTLDPLGQAAADEIVQELATTGLVRVGSVAAPGGASGGSSDQTASPSLTGESLWTLNDPEYVVTGSYSDWGGRLAYRARILEVESGIIVVAVGTVMGSWAEPTEATERLKRRVAGALAMVLDPRLSELTLVASHPPSFEAYNLLSDGLDFLYRGYAALAAEEIRAMMKAASTNLLQAAALDPGFTLPLVLSLEASSATDEVLHTDSVLQLLQPRRNELPRWERAMLDHHLAGRAQDHDGQYEAMRQVVRISPSPQWKYHLAQHAVHANRPAEALDLLTQLDTEPDWPKSYPDYWGWLSASRMLLGDYESALKDIDRARAFPSGGGGSRLFTQEVDALVRLGRVEEATDRSIEIIESTGHSGTQYLRYYLPRVLRSAGLEEQARRVAEVGLASFSRIEGPPFNYVAATLVCAGRYDEARQVLERPEDLRAGGAEPFSLLAYIAAREGNAEEAIRLSELAATAGDPSGETRSPYGVMSQVEVAAHLGDNAGAVRFLREAYELGLLHGPYVFTRWDLRPLEGYKPFEELMRPKG